MVAPTLVVLVSGLFVSIGGIVAYLVAESMASAVAGGAIGTGLVVSSPGVFRAKRWALLAAPFLILIAYIFFTYRFLWSGEVIPSGLMSALSVVALIAYFTWRSAN